MTPGPKFSTKTSPRSIIRRSSWRPFSLLRSQVTLFLFAFSSMK